MIRSNLVAYLDMHPSTACGGEKGIGVMYYMPKY